MKVRVKWTKTGVLKFIGHLDVQRYFQKALMRAELPVSFSISILSNEKKLLLFRTVFPHKTLVYMP